MVGGDGARESRMHQRRKASAQAVGARCRCRARGAAGTPARCWGACVCGSRARGRLWPQHSACVRQGDKQDFTRLPVAPSRTTLTTWLDSADVAAGAASKAASASAATARKTRVLSGAIVVGVCRLRRDRGQDHSKACAILLQKVVVPCKIKLSPYKSEGYLASSAHAAARARRQP